MNELALLGLLVGVIGALLVAVYVHLGLRLSDPAQEPRWMRKLLVAGASLLILGVLVLLVFVPFWHWHQMHQHLGRFI